MGRWLDLANFQLAHGTTALQWGLFKLELLPMSL